MLFSVRCLVISHGAIGVTDADAHAAHHAELLAALAAVHELPDCSKWLPANVDEPVLRWSLTSHLGVEVVRIDRGSAGSLARPARSLYISEGQVRELSVGCSPYLLLIAA